MNEQLSAQPTGNGDWLAGYANVDPAEATRLELYLADRINSANLQKAEGKTPDPSSFTVRRPGYDGYGRETGATNPAVEAMVKAGYLRQSKMWPGAVEIDRTNLGWQQNPRYQAAEAARTAQLKRAGAAVAQRVMDAAQIRADRLYPTDEDFPVVEIPRVTAASIRKGVAQRQAKQEAMLAELQRQRAAGET